MTEYTLSDSAVKAACPLMKELLKGGDFQKFLHEIEHDTKYSIVDNVIMYTGETTKRKVDDKELKAFKKTDYKPHLYGSAFVNSLGMPMYFDDLYRDSSAFLICGGPSLNKFDLSKLQEPGVLKMGVNNSPSIVRPNLWTCVDPPERFLKSVYHDPTITKFMHTSAKEKFIWDAVNNSFSCDKVIKDCPNISYYDRHANFNPSTFVDEPTFCWGNEPTRAVVCERTGSVHQGSKSCMLVAMKILIRLGVRRIFLIGADFHMDESKPYAFEQSKSSGGCNSNNNTYKALNVMFDKLRPEFESRGIEVYNVYKESGLKSFDYVEYEEAIKVCQGTVSDFKKEHTAGMYDNTRNSSKKEFEGKHHVPQEIKPTELNVTKVQPIAQARRYSITHVWEKRDEFIKMYPRLKSIADGCSQRIAKFEKKGKECKGCAMGRIIAPFTQQVINMMRRDSEKYKTSPILELDSILLFNKRSITIKEWING